uniref:Uncharacterized protein n=1 Tax=Oryza brachyantha TaxID=4533 RepID=J3ME41_ORYBR
MPSPVFFPLASPSWALTPLGSPSPPLPFLFLPAGPTYLGLFMRATAQLACRGVRARASLSFSRHSRPHVSLSLPISPPPPPPPPRESPSHHHRFTSFRCSLSKLIREMESPSLPLCFPHNFSLNHSLNR